MMKHPALLYFGETRQQRFPLVLVIGREPNTKMSMGNHAGSYDFREYPNAGFWNIAYSLLAEAVGLQGRMLKSICVNNNGSPILFGNALPHGVENKVANKLAPRMAVRSNASQHINNVFSFSDLISRVELVMSSGLDGDVFSLSREVIVEECRVRGLLLKEVPFFHGKNKASIKQALRGTSNAKMKDITTAFLASCPDAAAIRCPTQGCRRRRTTPVV